MRYLNNDLLRDYLDRGAVGAYRENLRHPGFEVDDAAFAATLIDVRAQHPGLRDDEAEARAAFRLLTTGVAPPVIVALPSRWYRTRAWCMRHAAVATRIAELLWAAALLLLALATVIMLSALMARSEPLPPPPVNIVSANDAVRALLLHPPELLPQIAGGSSAARVQFLNGANAWTNVSGANPLPVTGNFTCVSGCSGGGGGGGTSAADEAAFTEGTTTFTPAGGYYKTSPAALTSGQSGSVALTANRAFHVTLYGSGGSEISTLPVSGTFWQATQPVSWSGQTVGLTGTLPAFGATPTFNCGTGCFQTTQPVSGTFWQATQPVSGTFWQATQPVSCANGATCPVNATLSAETTKVIGTVNQGTSPWNVAGGGTAGSAASGVMTVQGIASMTKLLVTPDSVALPANQSVNVNQLAGTTTDTNSGNKSAGTLRVVLATDQPQLTNKLLVTPDANSAINVAQINGVTPLMGNGVTGTGSQRVTIASDNTAFSVKETDGTNTALVDPCKGQTKVYTPISQTAGATLVTGTSAKKQYVCHLNIVTATAQNVALVAGTGTVCATATHTVMGGTTAATGWNFAANGGIAIGSGDSSIGVTGTNADNLCLLQSSSGQISGVLVTAVQ